MCNLIYWNICSRWAGNHAFMSADCWLKADCVSYCRGGLPGQRGRDGRLQLRGDPLHRPPLHRPLRLAVRPQQQQWRGTRPHSIYIVWRIQSLKRPDPAPRFRKYGGVFVIRLKINVKYRLPYVIRFSGKNRHFPQFHKYLFSITVWSAAPQTTLRGGPWPRFKPGPGDLEAGTLATRPPLLLSQILEQMWLLCSSFSDGRLFLGRAVPGTGLSIEICSKYCKYLSACS